MTDINPPTISPSTPLIVLSDFLTHFRSIETGCNLPSLQKPPRSLSPEENALKLMCIVHFVAHTPHFIVFDDLGYPTVITQTLSNGEPYTPLRTSALEGSNFINTVVYDGAAWSSEPRPWTLAEKDEWPACSIHALLKTTQEECLNCNARSGKRCNCKYDDWARSQEHFKRFQLRVQYTNIHKGYGIFPNFRITKGQMLGEYVGVLIPLDARVSDEDSAYWASIPIGRALTKREAQRGKEEPKAAIDSRRYGSEFRFLSHSCHPNARLVLSRVGNRRIVAVEVLRDGAPEEEITIDYGASFTNSTVCYCGTAGCRHPPGLTKDEDDLMLSPVPMWGEDYSMLAEMAMANGVSLPDLMSP